MTKEYPKLDPKVVTGESIEDAYDTHQWNGDVLGSGAFSQVYSVVSRGSGEKRAVKRIDKNVMGVTVSGKKGKVIDLAPITSEILLQRECGANGANIVKIFDVFDSFRYVEIVLEPMLKEDLFDAIENVYYPEPDPEDPSAGPPDEECRYTELEASKIARQLISAIAACHECNVCHRDIKPENILVHEYHPLNPIVKLCDFGLAARCVPGDRLMEACGTPEYVAPEVVTKGHGYGMESDVWSIGVLLFILLSGEQPFHSELDGPAATKEVLEKVKMFRNIRTKFSDDPDTWEMISDDAKGLLENHLLVRDPSQRMSAAQLLQHPWVIGEAAPTKAIPQALMLHHKRWLRRKFRVAIFTLVATNRIRSLIRTMKVTTMVAEGTFSMSGTDAVDKYTKMLTSFCDAESIESTVDKATFVEVLTTNGVGGGKETEHFEVFADNAFSDHSAEDESSGRSGWEKRVNFRNYCISLMWTSSCEHEQKLDYIFKVFDVNRDDAIDNEEFILMMNSFHVVGKNERVNQHQIDEMFAAIDTNHDESIDLKEFMAWSAKSEYFLQYAAHMQDRLKIAERSTNATSQTQGPSHGHTVAAPGAEASSCCVVQ